MPMIDATERARPVMAYVADLQNKVRRLKADQARFRLVSFGWGALVGLVVSGLVVGACFLR